MDSKMLMKTYKLCLPMGNTIKGTSKKTQKQHRIHYCANSDVYDGEWQNEKRIGLRRIFAAGGGKLKVMFI
jgi:hypothetical protein